MNSVWNNAKNSIPKVETGGHCEVLAYGIIYSDSHHSDYIDHHYGYFLATYQEGYGFFAGRGKIVKYWAELPKPPEDVERLASIPMEMVGEE